MSFERYQRALEPVLRAVYRVEVRGSELVPARGPLVVAANHESVLDPFLLAVALPRPLRFMAKEELWRTRLLGRLLDHLGAIPVRRGRADARAVEAALAALAAGEAVAVFPQGGVRRAGPWLPGAARIALAAGATLLPVRLLGTARALGTGGAHRSRLAVLVGEPLPVGAPGAEVPGAAAARELTRLLESRVSALGQ